MGMRSRKLLCVLVVSLVSIALLGLASPAAAVDRNKGDFYEYEMNMDMMGITGPATMTYKYSGTDTITVNGTEYEVNKMKITGEMSMDLGIFGGNVSAAVSGYVYETRAGMGMVKDDMIINASMNMGVITVPVMMELVQLYSPPLLSGFDPGETQAGDTWTETVNVTSTMSYLQGSTFPSSPETDTYQMVYAVVVSSQTEQVTVKAGTFECLRITSTDQDGNREVQWWSSDVGNFVKEESYEAGAVTASSSMELVDYGHGSSMMLIVAIGGAILLIVVVAIVALMLMRRRPIQPVPYQPGIPPQPYMPPGPPPPPPANP